MKNRPFRERLGFAAAGLREGWAREASLRAHGRFAVAAGVALVVLRPAPLWWALIAVTIAAVVTLELLNSALEGFIDLIHPGIHPEIKVIKDMAAGAVLVASLAALAVGAALAVDRLPVVLSWLGVML